MSDRPEQMPENELRAPKRLKDDLGAFFEGAPAVPPQVDHAIRHRAHRRLARRRPRLLAVRLAVGAAAAAAVLLVVVLATPHFSGARRAATDASAQAPAIREDLDGNGRVDILDAFRLARRIEEEGVAPEWDFNADGTVDAADVDVIAMAAVRLNGGGIQ